MTVNGYHIAPDDDLALRDEILSKLAHICASATARGWVFPKVVERQ